MIGMAAAYQPTPRTYLAFGDSITQGMWRSSYPAKLEDLLRERHGGDFTIRNYGEAGEITAWGKKRLYRALFAEKPRYLLLMEGTNDLVGFGETVLSATVENLAEMVETAVQKGTGVVLANLSPRYDFGYLGLRVVETNQLIEEMAREEAAQYPSMVAFADVYAACINAGGGRLFEDGVHPNERGDEVIAEAFYRAIATNHFL